MKPQDMAKFGFLYLHNGLWNGTQVIPEEWIKESTQKQITANAATDYGYLFWLQTIMDTAKDKEYFTYRASGMGGQYIMVIPDLDSGSSSVPLSDRCLNVPYRMLSLTLYRYSNKILASCLYGIVYLFSVGEQT